eukprot:c7420_g1_i2.p1 GENE.c7420_g1_i2~~c7420_g1_i2.p1  ORF type:complete len:108 (+),score=38.12 c7420_g1_i2:2-325(+)
MAYCAQDVKWNEFQQLVHDSIIYLSHKNEFIQNDKLNHNFATEMSYEDISGTTDNCDQNEIENAKLKEQTKMKLIWISGLKVFSQAHPNSDYLSSYVFERINNCKSI